MKKINILTSIVLSTLSINLYADFSSQNGKIVQISERHIDKIPDGNDTLGSNSNLPLPDCTAYANTGYGTENQPAYLSGNVGFAVTNTSQETQYYKAALFMCVLYYGCSEKDYDISVYPGKTISYNFPVNYTISLPGGTYQDQAKIQVTGIYACSKTGINQVYIRTI